MEKGQEEGGRDRALLLAGGDDGHDGALGRGEVVGVEARSPSAAAGPDADSLGTGSDTCGCALGGAWPALRVTIRGSSGG
jgi:hypothetical protein